MTQWEYRQDAVPVDRHLRVLQAAGQEGWELCGVVPTALTSRVSVPGVPPTQPGLLLLFKRPIDAHVRRVNGDAGEWVFAR